MNVGIVKKIDLKQRMGYLVDKHGNMISFRLSDVIGILVAEEDKVEYDVIESNGDKMATNVKKIIAESPNIDFERNTR